jgi:hypothetical protein
MDSNITDYKSLDFNTSTSKHSLIIGGDIKPVEIKVEEPDIEKEIIKPQV